MYMQSILFEKSKQNYQKYTFRVFVCFFQLLMYQTLKYMQNALFGETEQHCQKCVYWLFLSFLGTKTQKCMQSSLSGVTEQHYQKHVIWDIFEHRHQNAKKKKNEKHSIWGYKSITPTPHKKKRVIWVFFCFLHSKTLKRVQNTLYGEIEYYKKW